MTEDILERAKPWARECGSCDYGLTTGCQCPDGDCRPIISDLMHEVERLRGATPAGMDARSRVVYTIHCSACGEAHEAEFGPSLWSAKNLSELSKFPLEDEDWELNLEGRALVCPGCHTVGWCEKCGDRIHAWEDKKSLEGDRRWEHVECRP